MVMMSYEEHTVDIMPKSLWSTQSHILCYDYYAFGRHAQETVMQSHVHRPHQSDVESCRM